MLYPWLVRHLLHLHLLFRLHFLLHLPPPPLSLCLQEASKRLSLCIWHHEEVADKCVASTCWGCFHAKLCIPKLGAEIF